MNDYVCSNSGAKHIRARIKSPQERLITVIDQVDWVRGYGRVTQQHREVVRDYYWVEVYNDKTGRMIYRSDAFGFKNAVALADQAVGTARWAWSMELKAKDLR